MTTKKKVTTKPRGRPKGKKDHPKPVTGNLNEPFTLARKKKYCDILSKTHDKLLARQKLGVDASTVRKHLKEDPVFRNMVDEAQEAFCNSLVAAAHRRGIKGLRRGLYYKGRPTKDENGNPVFEKHYSDKMLELLLKRYIPEFNPKSELQVTEKIDFNLDGMDLSKLTKEQRNQFRKLVEAAATNDDEE